MALKIVLAGGSGFIGAALARRFRERGLEVVVLTRARARRRGDGVREVQWDGRTVGAWAVELEGARAVVNLAGSTINCVHTEENRRRILQSRLEAVRVLGDALARCALLPQVWVQTSAVGIYGYGQARCGEDAPAGVGFKPEVCRQWEGAYRAACPAAVRDVVLRVGVVLGRKGGAYPPLAKVTKLFLGGAAGDGRQGISWILLDDLVEIFLAAVERETMRGVYNACAPEPVANGEFMQELRETLGRPWSPPAPAWAIRLVAPLVMRTEPDLILRGQYAIPARLLSEGFRFRAPQLRSALNALAD